MKGIFDFHPTSYQLDFAYDCINHKKVVAVFARQSGKSETTSKVAIMYARIIHNNPILVFAPTDKQAGLIAEKITKSIAKMPYLTDFHVTRQTLREFYFSNGGSIICMTTGQTGDTILGHTAGAIIEDESGSIKDTIIQTAILPMGATTNPPHIKIGTPKGKNHFYEASQNPRYKLHQITYKQALKENIHSLEYVEATKKMLTSDQWKTEMMAEFIEDQDAYFGYNLIEECVYDIKQINAPPHVMKCNKCKKSYAQGVVYCSICRDEKQLDKTKVHYLKLVKKDAGYRYVLGGDIARLGQDATTFVIAQIGEGDEAHQIVKIVEIAKSKLDYVVDEIIRLDEIWDFDKIYLDETGLGAGVVDFLGRQYNQRSVKQARPDKMRDTYNWQDKVVGIKFTMQSKLDMYSNLKNLMEQGGIYYPHNEKLIAQLRDFRYEIPEAQNVKLHHSDRVHDDMCDALALAAKGLVESEGGVLIDF